MSEDVHRLLSQILASKAAAEWRATLSNPFPSESADSDARQRIISEVGQAVAARAPALGEADRKRLVTAILVKLRRQAPASSAVSASAEADASRLRDNVLAEYPFPIARAYQRLRTDLDLFPSDRDAQRHLNLLKDGVETLVRYLALVALSARLDRNEPIGELEQEVLEGLVSPALGTWSQLLSRLLSAPETNGDARLAPLAAYCTKAFFGQIGEFTALRNSVLSHGLVRNPREDRNDVRTWLPRYETMLARAGFLTEWQLVQAATLPRSWMGNDALNEHKPARFEAARIADAAAGDGQFVLVVPEGRPISLFPFIYLLDCPACGKVARLFVYDSQKEYTKHKKRVGMVENVGGHKEAFKEPAEALATRFPNDQLLKHYQYYRRHFEVLEGKLTEFDFETYRRRIPFFVGRKRLLETLSRFFEGRPVIRTDAEPPPVDRGYFLLAASPGMGKTALLTYWIDHNDECPMPIRFFWRAGRNLTRLDFLRHVYHGLLAKHRIDDRDPPHDERDYPRKLDSLLKLVSERYLRDGEREIVVVDGLDEAGDATARRGALAALPRDLPQNVYFLLSSRRTEELDVLGREPNCRRYELNAGADWNLSDVREYIELQLGNLLAAGEIGADLLPAVGKAAQGNFLWAEQFCSGVRSGTLAPEAVAESLPRIAGLDELYQEFWRRILDQLSEPEKLRLWRLAGVLAVARAALTAEQICRFTGMEDVEFLMLRAMVQQYLDEIVQPSDRAEDAPLVGFRLYHATFRDFVLRQPGVVAGQHHERIVRAYGHGADVDFDSPAWDWYGLSFVLYHASQAERLDTVGRLLQDDRFWVERTRRLKSEDALAQTRELAENLERAGNAQWDSLTRCARRYCETAEELRGDVEAWDRMIRAGDINRVVKIIESDSDSTRSRAAMVAVGILLIESGEVDRGRDLLTRGLKTLGLEEAAPMPIIDCGSETRILLRAISNRTRDRMPNRPVDVDSCDEIERIIRAHETHTELQGMLRSGVDPRTTIPWIDLVAASVTRERLALYVIVAMYAAFSWVVIRAFSNPNSLDWLTSWPIKVSAILFVLWMVCALVTPIFRWLFLDVRFERLMSGLARLLDGAPTAHARKLALQAIRMQALRGRLSCHFMDLEHIAEKGLPLVADEPRDAARFLFDAACCGHAASDALVLPLRRLSPQKLRAIYAEASNHWLRSSNYAPLVRLFVLNSDRLADPGLLIDLMKGHGGRESDLAAALEGGRLSFLARTLLASMKPARASGIRRRFAEVRSLAHQLALTEKTLRLSPWGTFQVLTFASLFLILFALAPMAFATALPIVLFLCAIAGRQHDPYSLVSNPAPSEPDAWTNAVAQNLSRQRPILTFGSVEVRRLREAIVAQSILRGGRMHLPPDAGAAGRRTVKHLFRGGLLDQPGTVLLNAMGDRSLLDLVLNQKPPNGGTRTVRAINRSDQLNQLRSVLPIRPWWRSLVLLGTLGIAGTAIWLGFVGLFNPPLRHSLLTYTIWQDAGICIYLAILYHFRSAFRSASRLFFPSKASRLPPAKPGTFRTLVAFAGPYVVGFGSLKLLLAACDAASAKARGAGLESPQFGRFADSSVQFAFCLIPLVITNYLVPELIARWRGAGLFYPLRGQRWRHGLLWTFNFILALLLLAAFVSLGLAGLDGSFVCVAILSVLVLVPWLL